MNIETIKQRKAMYGDNFKPISDKWSKYLNKDISPKDVAKMMSLMKEVRIKMTQDKITNGEYDSEYILKDLVDSLEDSITDKENYTAIAENFDWYEKVGTDEEYSL